MGRQRVGSINSEGTWPNSNSTSNGPDKKARRSLEKVAKHFKEVVKSSGGDNSRLPKLAKESSGPYKNIFPNIKFDPGATPLQAWKGFLSWLRKLVRRAKEKLGKNHGTYNIKDFWNEPDHRVILAGFSSFLKGATGGPEQDLVQELESTLKNKELNGSIYCDVGCSCETEGCEFECPLHDDDWDALSTGSDESGYYSGGDSISLSSLTSGCESVGEQVGDEPIYVNIQSGNPTKPCPLGCFRCIFLSEQQKRGLHPNGNEVEKLLLKLCILYLDQEVSEGKRTRLQALNDLSQILVTGNSD